MHWNKLILYTNDFLGMELFQLLLNQFTSDIMSIGENLNDLFLRNLISPLF